MGFRTSTQKQEPAGVLQPSAWCCSSRVSRNWLNTQVTFICGESCLVLVVVAVGVLKLIWDYAHTSKSKSLSQAESWEHGHVITQEWVIVWRCTFTKTSTSVELVCWWTERRQSIKYNVCWGQPAASYRSEERWVLVLVSVLVRAGHFWGKAFIFGARRLFKPQLKIWCLMGENNQEFNDPTLNYRLGAGWWTSINRPASLNDSLMSCTWTETQFIYLFLFILFVLVYILCPSFITLSLFSGIKSFRWWIILYSTRDSRNDNKCWHVQNWRLIDAREFLG